VTRRLRELVEVLDRLSRDESRAAVASTLWRLRRRFIDHLPAPDRPLPGQLRDLDRPDDEWLLLAVTKPPHPPGQLHLHDLVVRAELRGQGAGTAALQELLAFADHTHARIVAECRPSPLATDQACRSPGRTAPPADQLAMVARWCYRHGFRIHDAPPERWAFGAQMAREPDAP
jgi:GNAT superfamily N-acetyltransferase